jgi:hypothetical protein
VHALVPTSILWADLWEFRRLFFYHLLLNEIAVMGADEEGTLERRKALRRRGLFSFRVQDRL